MHAHTHTPKTHMHAHTPQTCMHAHTHALLKHVHAHTCTHSNTCMHAHALKRACTRMHTHMITCMHIILFKHVRAHTPQTRVHARTRTHSNSAVAQRACIVAGRPLVSLWGQWEMLRDIGTVWCAHRMVSWSHTLPRSSASAACLLPVPFSQSTWFPLRQFSMKTAEGSRKGASSSGDELQPKILARCPGRRTRRDTEQLSIIRIRVACWNNTAGTFG